MYIHPCFARQLKPTWRPVRLADMAMCNEWCVEVAIALYDKCSQLDHVIILQFGTQVSIPRNTVTNSAKYLLRFRTEENL